MGFMLIVPPILMAVSAASQPATAPATTQATRPILTSGDPNVDRILERLERRGDGVNSLTAGLEAEFHDLVADDKQTKIGKLWFRRDKPNPKFKVVYEKSLFEDVEVVDPREYLFDGQWLTEKHDKSKTFVHREIVGQGERIDVFRIGKGPFPLPFGQKKADILEHFDVTLVPRSPKDPPGTEHLRLIPHKDSPMAEKYVELHFYIDPKIDLPVRVVSHQRRPGSTEVDEIVTVTFKDIRINPPVPDGILSIEKPTGKEWHISEEPLPSKPFPPDSRQ